MAFTCTSPPGKNKVLFIMGATGTGKSKLSIELGTQFPSEIINSDKIQVYKGLDIVTNKVPLPERCGIPHHLLGIIDDPNSDFTVNDFCKHVLAALALIIENGHLPIIVGGSNSYLKELVDDPNNNFRSKYDCCFIWVDVSLDVLFPYLDKRVDEMVDAGLVDEIRKSFEPESEDYTQGIRRAIGVAELDQYFRVEKEANVDVAYKEKMLQDAIGRMKENTHELAKNQLEKIHKMKNELGWEMTRIDSTQVFQAISNGEDYKHLYREVVFQPGMEIAKRFVEETTQGRGKIANWI